MLDEVLHRCLGIGMLTFQGFKKKEFNSKLCSSTLCSAFMTSRRVWGLHYAYMASPVGTQPLEAHHISIKLKLNSCFLPFLPLRLLLSS